MADEGEPIVETQAIVSQPLKVDFNPRPETNQWKVGLFSCRDDLKLCEKKE